MPRPFRFEPPWSSTALVARSRLESKLQERWVRRLVTIVAGPGFGKTTLLRSMVADDEPGRQSIWLTCEPSDESADRLLSGLVEALGVRRASGVESILDAVWSRAPNEVCFVLDDVHEVPPGSEGAALIVRLVQDLSANGHLVLASRDTVPVPLGRLAATGQLLRISEQELLFDEPELQRFADERGVDLALLDSTGGWPAVAELVAATNADLVPEYLWDEVLTGLGEPRASLLARLAIVGGGDDAVVSAIAGRATTIDDAIGPVPLVERTAEGWAVPHPLWRPALRSLVSTEQAMDDRRCTATVHRRAGRFRSAAELLIEAEAWDELLAMIPEAADRAVVLIAGGATAGGELGLAAVDFGRWFEALPGRHRDDPEALLASGLDLASRNPASAAPVFAAAAAAFRSRRDIDGELCAIHREGFIRWWLNDVDRLFALHGRAVELAESGSAGALALTAIGEASIAHLVGDSETVLTRLDGMGAEVGEWLGPVRWLRSVAHRRNGDLNAALAELEPDIAAGARDPQAVIARLRALWLAGEIAEVLAGLRSIREEYDPAHDAFLWRQLTLELAAKAAWLGDNATAHELLDETANVLAETPTPLADVLSAIARSAAAITDGNEGAAAEIVGGEARAGAAAVGGGTDWYWRDRAATALVFVLVPETRDEWRQRSPSATHQLGISLAEGLLAARAGDHLGVRAMVWPSNDLARIHLPVHWLLELAVAGHVAGNAPPDGLIGEIGPVAGRLLRELAERTTGRTREVATMLSKSIPTIPAYSLRLELLGPLRVRRDGVLVEDAHLARRRVRELLCLLVARRRIHRESVAEELWPDAADPAHNLSVTLNYVQRVLQPERARQTPPFFVRTNGDWLELTASDRLQVDVWDLEVSIDDALSAERNGTVADAVSAYRDALTLWQGQPFADALYADWAELERTRLRGRFVGAAERAAELMLASGDIDGGRAAASVAIEVAPNSEPAFRVLARSYLGAGDRTSARAILERCLRGLAELGLDPDPTTLQLSRSIGGLAPS